MSAASCCSAIRVKLSSPERSGFGVVAAKHSDTPPCLAVSCLLPGSPAASSGLLRPGDVIVKINAIDVSCCGYAEALSCLQATEQDAELRLLIRAPPGYSTHLETTFDGDGCPRTYRVTERLYSVAASVTTARGSSGSINLNLDDGTDDADIKRR